MDHYFCLSYMAAHFCLQGSIPIPRTLSLCNGCAASNWLQGTTPGTQISQDFCLEGLFLCKDLVTNQRGRGGVLRVKPVWRIPHFLAELCFLHLQFYEGRNTKAWPDQAVTVLCSNMVIPPLPLAVPSCIQWLCLLERSHGAGQATRGLF